MDRSKQQFVQWLEEMLEELVEGVSTPLEVCVVRVFICPCVWTTNNEWEMVKVYRYYHSEEGKGKTKQTLHCFKSLLAIYFPLIIFCTSNYPMSCSFVSRQKNLLGEKSGHQKTWWSGSHSNRSFQRKRTGGCGSSLRVMRYVSYW